MSLFGNATERKVISIISDIAFARLKEHITATLPEDQP
jgi:hypothetical protein